MPLRPRSRDYRLRTLATYVEQEAAADDAVRATQDGLIAELTTKPITTRSLAGLLEKLDALLDQQEAEILAAVETALTRSAKATADHATP